MNAQFKPLPGLIEPDDMSGDRQFSTNLARGLQVLRAYTPADPSLSNSALCARTGLPKATISRITYTLTLLGYLTRTPDQRYALGAGVLSLGYPMLAAMRIRQVARPWLEKLASTTRSTVNLGIRDRLSVVYVETCRGDAANITRPDIGSVRPLLTSSIGRALLLASPAAERTAILNRLRVDDPDRFRLESPLWERDRDGFAQRGYCVSHGDWQPEIHAVAVALKQPLQTEVMAINCTLHGVPRQASRQMEQLAARLLDTARRIEMDCRAPAPPPL